MKGATDTTPGPLRRPNRAHDARRAEVITLAAGLFDQRGYASVSMEQIAAAAGIAKPTLYHYFRAKDRSSRIHETFIDLLLEHQDERIRLGLAPATAARRDTDIFG